MTTPPSLRAIALLHSLLSWHDKVALVALLGLSVIVSCIETLSISAVMVFVTVATNAHSMAGNRWYQALYNLLGCSNQRQFLLLFGSLLIIFYLLRALLAIVHTYLIAHFSYTRYHDFAGRAFTRYLSMPYHLFAGTNSASIAHVLFSSTGTVAYAFLGLLTLTAELITVLCVYGLLFVVNWKMTLVLTVFVGIQTYVVLRLFTRHIARTGKQTQQWSVASNKIFHEAHGNFKLLKLLGTYEDTHHRFASTTQQYASAQIMYQTLQGIPRFIIETMGFVLMIGMLLYVTYRYGNAQSILPLVSLYALAFYRLLPSLNKILSSINQVVFATPALENIHQFLATPVEALGDQSLDFRHELQLQNISFGYHAHTPVIDQQSLVIRKGERIALVGPSGGGKSTLVDVLMALYQPKQGQLLVDGVLIGAENVKAWRHRIGYIPQTIYLFDGTIGDNVVFGRPYDEAKLIRVLQQAHVYDFIMTQQGLQTMVGEGGVRLSGGQKQRIAIARALYGSPSILVLDEATSALDYQTEGDIMDEVYGLGRDMTIIIIAHRLSTIARCDRVYRVQDGAVVPEPLVSFETATTSLPQDKRPLSATGSKNPLVLRSP